MRTHRFALALGMLCAVAGSVAGQPTRTQVGKWFDEASKLDEDGELKQALALNERVLAEILRLYGEGSIDQGKVLNNLGNNYRDLADYANAETLLRHSL